MENLPTIADVRAAAKRIAGEVVRTPLLRSDLLDARAGGRVFLKAENLQRTGSFKFRGAFNAVSACREAAQGGVVACSSGNHAQGVAEAAAIHGLPATIVMPRDAPKAKMERTRRAGATVVEYERFEEDRTAIAQGIAERDGAVFIHPYEDPYVIAGQGTCGLEIVEQLREVGAVPDAVLVCAGGGGLASGVSLAVRDAFTDVAIHAVEPEGFDDQRRSLERGERVAVEPGHTSVCDAIVTEMPGERAFAILRDHASGLVVSDDEVLRAVAFAFHELKLVVEPGGAVALAAILFGKLPTRGRTLVATLSGGNIDPAMLHRALAAEEASWPGAGA